MLKFQAVRDVYIGVGDWRCWRRYGLWNERNIGANLILWLCRQAVGKCCRKCELSAPRVWSWTLWLLPSGSRRLDQTWNCLIETDNNLDMWFLGEAKEWTRWYTMEQGDAILRCGNEMCRGCCNKAMRECDYNEKTTMHDGPVLQDHRWPRAFSSSQGDDAGAMPLRERLQVRPLQYLHWGVVHVNTAGPIVAFSYGQSMNRLLSKSTM